MATLDKEVVATNIMKIKYKKSIDNTIIARSEIWDLFHQMAGKVQGSETEGKYFQSAVAVGAVESTGARSELGFMPVPGRAAWLNGIIRLKKNLTTFQTTWNLLRNAVEGEAAFASFTKAVIAPAIESAIDSYNRQAIGYGVGILFRVDGTPATTMPIDAPYGIASNVGAALTVGLRRGMTLVAGPNSDGSGLRSGGQSMYVESVNFAGNSGGGTFTCQSFPGDMADNDYFWIGDSYDNNAPADGVEKEMMGLLGMVDDGTYLPVFQNIDRSVYTEWQSPVTDASAAPYSGGAPQILFQKLSDDQGTYGKGVTTHQLTTPAIWRQALLNFTGNGSTLGLGGFGATQNPESGLVGSAKGISYFLNGKKVELRKVDRMPQGTVFSLDSSTLERYGDENGEFDDRTGSMWRQVMVGGVGKDEYYAVRRLYAQLGCNNPHKNAVARGMNESLA